MRTTDFYDNFIDNLRDVVEKSGLKHKVIAERCGMTQNQFSARLYKRQKVTVKDIPVICAALNVQANDLFARSE